MEAKLRSNWLEQGDNYTKFFQKMADAHRKYNHINSLVINGDAVSNEESINNGSYLKVRGNSRKIYLGV